MQERDLVLLVSRLQQEYIHILKQVEINYTLETKYDFTQIKTNWQS